MPPASGSGGTAAHVASSPPSGSDHTHYNTPSTNVTVLSPDTAVNIGRVAPPAPKLDLRALEVPHGVTTSSSSVTERQLAIPATSALASLSPTATEFTPSVAVAPFLPRQALQLNVQARDKASSTFGAVGQALPVPIVINDFAIHSPIVLTPHVTVAFGFFSNEENITRIIEIFGDPALPPAVIANAFPVLNYPSLDQIDSSEMHRGIHRVIFHDIRDARVAYVEAFYAIFRRVTLTFLPAKNLAMARGLNPANVSNCTAQVLVTVVPHKSTGVNIMQLRSMLQTAGSIYAVHSAPAAGPGVLCFRVEFGDVRDAERAVARAYIDFEVALLRFAPFNPDVVKAPVTPVEGALASPFNDSVATYDERPSYTGRSTLPHDQVAEVTNLLTHLVGDVSLSGHGLGRATHNQVDIPRITNGHDVRTTIMLRNIPNRVTQDDLKNYLDETSRGAYDFMYLRIDFANNCNVGYAFVNFVDPLAIVPFARRRAGARWNIYDSNKVAEISYATIQGRDCLIQKFRNSSVMLEHPHYRPKLYYTGTGPLGGTEERFPGPDNIQKMRRSIENAEHIGLYIPMRGNRRYAVPPARVADPGPQSSRGCTKAKPLTGPLVNTEDPTDPFSGHGAYTPTPRTGLFAPREGQQHREEQRRRRSQFDRGTPGAEFDAQLRGARAFHSGRY